MLRYCISHEEMDVTYHILDDELHYARTISNPEEWSNCDGPFTSCPPPELPEDWEMVTTPPSPDELEQMDANAEELLLEVA